jgi:hypothetical protein
MANLQAPGVVDSSPSAAESFAADLITPYRFSRTSPNSRSGHPIERPRADETAEVHRFLDRGSLDPSLCFCEPQPVATAHRKWMMPETSSVALMFSELAYPVNAHACDELVALGQDSSCVAGKNQWQKNLVQLPSRREQFQRTILWVCSPGQENMTMPQRCRRGSIGQRRRIAVGSTTDGSHLREESAQELLHHQIRPPSPYPLVSIRPLSLRSEKFLPIVLLGFCVFLYLEVFILPNTPRVPSGDQSIYLEHNVGRGGDLPRL